MNIKKILIADSHYFNSDSVVGQKQYALEFARNNWQVAYIANALSLFNTLLGKNKKKIAENFMVNIKGGININKHLWYFVPFTLLPFHNNTIFDRKWNIHNYFRYTIPSIKSIIRKREFSSIDVLWLGTAHQRFWIDILDYKCCIYRIADNIKAFRKTGQVLMKAEEEAIQLSDIILLTSKVLFYELRIKYPNKELIYFPNGVDLDNFMRSHYEKPEEYYGIDNLIALYVGSIGEWFDQNLLNNVAKLCPEIIFIIIGVDHCGKMKKISSDNIYYLGPKNYHDIPDYIYYSDCGIIPFNDSNLVQSINPIKMYEFFSLGKPVISREWKELKLLNSPCFLANNAREFADILKNEKTFSVNSKKLVSYALDNTWHKRYLKVLRILDNYDI